MWAKCREGDGKRSVRPQCAVTKVGWGFELHCKMPSSWAERWDMFWGPRLERTRKIHLPKVNLETNRRFKILMKLEDARHQTFVFHIQAKGVRAWHQISSANTLPPFWIEGIFQMKWYKFKICICVALNDVSYRLRSIRLLRWDLVSKYDLVMKEVDILQETHRKLRHNTQQVSPSILSLNCEDALYLLEASPSVSLPYGGNSMFFAQGLTMLSSSSLQIGRVQGIHLLSVPFAEVHLALD